jgi:hypothetical protein
MFDVLNAATGTLKQFAKDSFALGKRLSPNVFSVVHQKIEGEGNRRPVIDPAMQCIELRNAVRIEPNNFSIENGRALNVRGALHNQRITL